MLNKPRFEKENFVSNGTNDNVTHRSQKSRVMVMNTKVEQPISSLIAQASLYSKVIPAKAALSSRNMNVPAEQKMDMLKSETLTDNQEMPKDKFSKEIEIGRCLKHYSHDQLEYFKEFTLPQCSLSKHSISQSLRAKMIDWMVEVLSSYRCREQTFFIAVTIMDYYMETTKKQMAPQDLHLLGVASMFMASKYEEIYPIKLQVVYEKIAHKKLTKEEIKAKEAEIITSLNFKFIKVTLYEIMNHLLAKIGVLFKISQKCKDYLSQTSVYLAKMTLFDYEFYSKIPDGYSLCVLAGALIVVSFKIIEQADLLSDTDIIVKQNYCKKIQTKTSSIPTIFQFDKLKLMDYSNKVLKLAKSFETLFPQLENLKKFSSFTFPKE